MLEPLGLRILRSFALCGLLIALIPMVGIVAYTFLGRVWPNATETFDHIESEIRATNFDSMASGVTASVGIGLAVLVLGAMVLFFLTMWWLRLYSWGWILSGYAAVIPFGVYLWRDEPLRFHFTPQELSTNFAGAEHAYAVLMRHSKAGSTLSPEAMAFDKDPRLDTLFLDTSDPVKLGKSIVLQRAEFEQAWLDWEPQRLWLMELNSFERLPDLSFEKATDVYPAIIWFRTWRSLNHCFEAKAIIQALDGDGDAAINTLLPVLDVAQKLSPDTRSLVRSMVAIVIERQLIKTANFILDHSTVSPAAQAKLALTLNRAMNDQLRAQRLMMSDFYFIYHVLHGKEFDGSLFEDSLGAYARWIFHYAKLGRLIYQPNRTLNQYGDFTLQAGQLVARRRLNAVDLLIEQFFTTTSTPSFRNLLGDHLIANAIPAYKKVIDSLWMLADERSALKTRLAAAPKA